MEHERWRKPSVPLSAQPTFPVCRGEGPLSSESGPFRAMPLMTASRA
jgi:hypothetical protein